MFSNDEANLVWMVSLLRSKQQERMAMIRLAMQNQLGVDAANSHYDIATSSVNNSNNPITSAVNGINNGNVEGINPTGGVVQGSVSDLVHDVAEDGMYL